MGQGGKGDWTIGRTYFEKNLSFRNSKKKIRERCSDCRQDPMKGNRDRVGGGEEEGMGQRGGGKEGEMTRSFIISIQWGMA